MANELLIALVQASNAHAKACISAFSELNLSPGQPKVLSCLNFKEGYLQKELAALCRVEPATMTVLLNTMEKNGLIRKEISHVSGGKRAYRIFLTENGREVAQKVDGIVDGVERKSFQGFSAKEREDALRALEKIAANLSPKDTVSQTQD